MGIRYTPDVEGTPSPPWAPLVLIGGLLSACADTPLEFDESDADVGPGHDVRAPNEPPTDAAADAARPRAPTDGSLPRKPDVTPPARPSRDAGTTPMPPVEPAPELPPLPVYSHGACPPLVGGPTSDTSVVAAFPSGDTVRSFRLVVPDNYDGSEPWPLVFAWHWLNASSGSFMREGELETATEQMRFIAVVPDALRDANGDRAFLLSWPFAEAWGIEPEAVFFDDLLACVNEQLNVDRERVYGIGVSAGGLWLTYLSTTERANHFAALEVLSGGLGDMLGVWRMEYQPQRRKFPAVVLWGGPTDWLGLSFHEASIRYRDALLEDGHFVVECTHDAGHGVPPVESPPGITRFQALWRFMLDHDYRSPSGWSPYQRDGLPEIFPDWCRVASP